VLWGRLKAYNAIGCRRAGFDRPTITAIRGVYQRLQTYRTTSAALAAIRVELPDLPEVHEILDFIEKSRRGIVNSHPDLRRASHLEHASAEHQPAGIAMEE
jgi:acyl-[acyl carrier protein]--UDP-N-acetylglucosamine O-acyltransferase